MSEIIKELRFYSGDRNLNNNQATFSSNQIGALAENIFLKDGTVLEDSLGDINFMEKGSLMSQINNMQQIISTQIESSGNRFIKQTGGQVYGNLLFKNLDGTTPNPSTYLGPNGLQTYRINGGTGGTFWYGSLFFATTNSKLTGENKKVGSILPGFFENTNEKILSYQANNRHIFKIGTIDYANSTSIATINANGLEVHKNLSVTGSTTLKGTTTLQNTLTVSGTYKTTLGGALEVAGGTSLKSALGVTGNTTIGGTLGVTGATTLNGTTINGTLKTTGNTTVGGTLGVTGKTTLTTLATTGNVSLGGTLGVTGATTLNGTTLNGVLTANKDIRCGSIRAKTNENEFILYNGFQDAIIIDTLADVVNLMKPSRKYPYHKPYPVVITRRGYIYLRTQLDVAYGGTSGVTYHGGNIVETQFVHKYGNKTNITISGKLYTPKEAVKLEAVNQYILGHFVKIQNAVAGGQDGVAVIFGIGQRNGLPLTIRYRFTYDKSEKVTSRKYFIISGMSGETLKSATL